MSAATRRMLEQMGPTWAELEQASGQLREMQRNGKRHERGNVGIALRLIAEDRAAAKKKPVVMPAGYELSLDQTGLQYLEDKPTREQCRRLFFSDVTPTQVQDVLLAGQATSWEGVVGLLTRQTAKQRSCKANLTPAGRVAGGNEG